MIHEILIQTSCETGGDEFLPAWIFVFAFPIDTVGFFSSFIEVKRCRAHDNKMYFLEHEDRLT